MQLFRGKGGIGPLPGDAARFKLISGTLGHLAGEMLVDAAARRVAGKDTASPAWAFAAWHPDGSTERRAV